MDGYAECYRFDENGNCYINTTTPDGYTVDQNCAWTVNGAVQRCISVTGNLGYYDKRTGLAQYYNQQSGRIILSMYPDTTVSRIHFRNASENTPDGSFVSWRGYEGKNVTIAFVGGEPELYSTEGGEPLDAVGYMGVNVKIYTN